MLSNHYPLAFATEYSWAIAGLVFLMGVTIRHYFNTMHVTGAGPNWTWGATVILFIGIIWLSSVPIQDETGDAQLSSSQQRFAQADGFEQVHDIVLGRCSMCHAREPVWDGIRWAPKGVYLETEADVARHARDIYLQSGVSHAMPPANITGLPAEDRRLLVDWYRTARLSD